MKRMNLSDAGDVTMDLQRLVTTRMLLQANSGGGKSWALRRILEQSHGDVQQIVIDVEDEFYTLREKFDYILVRKEGGDCVPDVRSAGLLAHRLLELGVSAIISIYEMKSHERIAFVRDFLDALVNAPKKLWHPALIVVDEAHVFCPEKEEAASAGSVIDLMTRGRKRGFCGILATQRISKLAKDAAAEANNKLIGRAALDVDMKRAGDEIGFVSKDDRLSLRQLKPGQFFAFGPAISDIVIPVKIGGVQTTHPKAGGGVTPIAPPKHKVQSVLAKLSDLPQQAEEERATVASLKQEIRELRTKLTLAQKGQPKAAPEVKIEKREVCVLKDSQITRLEKFGNGFSILLCAERDKIDKLFAKFEAAVGPIKDGLAKAQSPPNLPVTFTRVPAAAPIKKTVLTKPTPTEQKTNHADGEFRLSRKQQDILDAIAWYESNGNPRPTLTQVGAVALIDGSGGHFSNVVGPLSSNGLVIRDRGSIELTDKGRQFAKIPDSVGTLTDYHEVLRRRVRQAKSSSSKTVEILDAIIRREGADVTTEEIGKEVGIDHTGGHFSNTIGPLGTLGLIKRSHGIISPTEIIFPKGLI